MVRAHRANPCPFSDEPYKEPQQAAFDFLAGAPGLEKAPPQRSTRADLAYLGDMQTRSIFR
jgi:hypothetical protein